jgi:hypothetical protein
MLTTEHKQILFILGLDRAVAALERQPMWPRHRSKLASSRVLWRCSI